MPGVSHICARTTRLNSPTPRAWPPPTTAPGSWRSNGTGRAAPRPRSSARTRSAGTGSRDRPGSTTRRDAASPPWRDGTPRRPPGSGRTSTGSTEGLPEGARRAPEFTTVGLAPGRWEPWTPLGVWLATHILFAGFPAKLWREEVVRHLGPDAVGLFATDGPGTSGSNGWLVTGERTATGAPVIAGDPHRYIEAPGVYQQIRLACPEFDVVGLAVPGVPGIAHFGHTGTVAWAITNAMADYQDLYRERLRRTGHGDRVEALGPDGAWHPASRHTEIIEVAGGDPVEVEVIETDRGPVVIDGDFTGGDADPDLDGVPNGGGPAGPLSLRYPPRVTEDLGFCARSSPSSAPAGSPTWTARSTTGPNPSTSSRPPTPRAACCTGSRAGSPSRSEANRTRLVPAWEPGHEWRGWYAPMPRGTVDDGIAVMANQRGPADPARRRVRPAPPGRPGMRALLGTRRDRWSAADMAAAPHGHPSRLRAPRCWTTSPPSTTSPPRPPPCATGSSTGTATWTADSTEAALYAAVRGAVVRRLAAHPAFAAPHRTARSTPRSSAPGSPSSRASPSPSKPAAGPRSCTGSTVPRSCRAAVEEVAGDPPRGTWGDTHRLAPWRALPDPSYDGRDTPGSPATTTACCAPPPCRGSPTWPRAAPPPATCGIWPGARTASGWCRSAPRASRTRPTTAINSPCGSREISSPS